MAVRLFPSQSRLAPRRVPRALVVVLLGLQAFLWGAGSIAEARTAAESLARYSHVEDQSTSKCPPLHSHVDCVICRTFASGAVTAHARDLLSEAARAVSIPSAPTVGARTAGSHGPVGSRAPPAVREPTLDA